MYLDLVTMASAEITVAAVLAGMLLLVWGRDGWSLEAAPSFVGLWGLSALIFSIGSTLMLSFAVLDNAVGVSTGVTIVVLSAAVKWYAARRFAGRGFVPIWILLGPACFLAAAYSGLAPTVDDRFVIACSIVASYYFLTAVELARMPDALQSWPATTLLVLGGATYSACIPIALSSPLLTLSDALTSEWFPFVVLATMLFRVALAFVTLSIAKDREEAEQRRNALTDSLTGLANRRALFDAAEAIVERRVHGGGTPVSLMIIDLDHFKETNDTFGHTIGDQVLCLFAKVVQETLEEKHVVGRLGGEEFAAILPGTDGVEAVEVAERLRVRFGEVASFVSGLPVGSTVSIGVTVDQEVDSGLARLFRRADAALYAAKSEGRNKVVFLAKEDPGLLGPEGSVVRTSPRRIQLSRVPTR